MAEQWAETTLVRETMPGIVVRLVDSSYPQGGTASKRDDCIELRLRLSPSKSPIRAGLEGGRLSETGRLMYIPSQVDTTCISDVEQKIRSLSLQIEPYWIERTMGVPGQQIPGESATDFNISNEQIHRAMQRISAEIMSPNEYSNTVIDACCRLISAELLLWSERKSRCNENVRDIIVEKRVAAIENFIYEFGDGCPTLTDVARELNLGVGYVRQFYKNATQRTLFDFIQDVRIARAQALLTEKKIPLKIISHKLGFCTPSAFSVAFRKATGVTPREYRARGAYADAASKPAALKLAN